MSCIGEDETGDPLRRLMRHFHGDTPSHGVADGDKRAVRRTKQIARHAVD
jgi:hypothetical protein